MPTARIQWKLGEWYKPHRTKNCPPSLLSPFFTPPVFRIGTPEENQCVYCGGVRNINVDITCTVFGFYAVSHWTACNVEVSGRVVSLHSFCRSFRIKSRKNNWSLPGATKIMMTNVWYKRRHTIIVSNRARYLFLVVSNITERKRKSFEDFASL